MIAPPGFPQQQPDPRQDALLRAFLAAKQQGSRATNYGHQQLGGGVGGAFTSNVPGAPGSSVSDPATVSQNFASFLPLAAFAYPG